MSKLAGSLLTISTNSSWVALAVPSPFASPLVASGSAWISLMTMATGSWTVNAIEVFPERSSASVMEHAKVLTPSLVPPSTVAENEKILSPAAASPFKPSSRNACVALPPMDERSQLTAKPVLAGFVPGVTVTASRLGLPGATVAGVAEPAPDGFVGPATTNV